MKAFMCLLSGETHAGLADITSCLSSLLHHHHHHHNHPPPPPQTGSDSLQGLNEAGEEVGHPAADLRAAVSQTSLVQEGHLEEEEEERSHSVSHTEPQCDGLVLTRTVGMCSGSTMKNLS